MPLDLHVVGFSGFDHDRDQFKFDNFLTSRIMSLLPTYNPGHRPVLVFCMSQRGAANTGESEEEEEESAHPRTYLTVDPKAEALSQAPWLPCRTNTRLKAELLTAANTFSDRKLQSE